MEESKNALKKKKKKKSAKEQEESIEELEEMSEKIFVIPLQEFDIYRKFQKIIETTMLRSLNK